MADSKTVNWKEFDDALDEVTSNTFDDKALAAILKSKIIGQDRAADEITVQLKRRIAQATASKGKVEKPLGVFLLAGPPGVGKTYFCKVLASNMYDGKGKILHINMAEKKESHTLSSLIGSPPGYQGGSGALTNALEQNPKLIVLLDEFEKAHTDIHKVFLTAWNDGFITDAKTSKKVSTTQALFMLTTNAAWDRLEEIEKSFADDPDGRDRAVNETLKQDGYVAEVLSRIDYTFVFQPLDSRGLGRVAALEIEALAGRLNLKIEKIDVPYLVSISKQPRFQGAGIRDLARALERALTDDLIEAQRGGAKIVRILYKDGRPAVEVVKDASPAAAGKTVEDSPPVAT